MKLSLIFPPNTSEYRDITWSDRGLPSAPQTAPVELGAYVRKYVKDVTVLSISPVKPIDNGFGIRTKEELLKLSEDSSFIGLTCLYSNQSEALDLAVLIKQSYPNTEIILGGPNVSNKFMARKVLELCPSVDYVCIGDGEDALVGLVNGDLIRDIPNLVYRESGTIVFNRNRNVDLDRIPIWDLGDSLDGTTIIYDGGYDSRTDLYKNLREKFAGRPPGEIGVFSRRGCVKATGEIGSLPGFCKFCTSVAAVESRVMNPKLFWEQVKFLYDRYGINDLFISDNVFGVTLTEILNFEKAKKQVGVSDEVNFRAYSYPSILLGPEGRSIAEGLKRLGITNIFLGIENFDRNILRLMNKEYVSPEDVKRTIKILSSAGIDSFIPLLLGLPGESDESLQLNLREFKYLIEEYGSQRTDEGNLVRLDISPALPLIGTAWFMMLKSNPNVSRSYKDITGKDLSSDLCPDFELLRKLNLDYFGSVTTERIFEVKDKLTQIALEYLPPSIACGSFDKRIKIN